MKKDRRKLEAQKRKLKRDKKGKNMIKNRQDKI